MPQAGEPQGARLPGAFVGLRRFDRNVVGKTMPLREVRGHRQVRSEPPQLVVDQAVQRGTKTREARLVSRKNEEAYVLDLTEDVLAAVDWHVSEGYAGPEFLFSKNGVFPRYIDSHVRPLKLVQQKLGLRMLSHHKVGGGIRSRAKRSRAANR
jgi:hypothetical protein